MKIVIDIPKEYYEVLKTMSDDTLSMDMLIIKNGTPLPKGHGDLIERDNFIKDLRDSKKGFWRKKHFIKGEATMESMAYEINDIKHILNNVPTIIEGRESE